MARAWSKPETVHALREALYGGKREYTPQERADIDAYWAIWKPRMAANNNKWLPGQPTPPHNMVKRTHATGKKELRHFIRNLQEHEGLFTADPIEILIYMAATGTDPLDALKPREERTPVAMDVRIDCAKAAAAYVRPKLAATTLSGKEGGAAIKLETADLDVMSRDPKVRAAFEHVTAQLAEHVLEHEQEHDDALRQDEGDE